MQKSIISSDLRQRARSLVALTLVLLAAGCATPPPKGPSAEEIARQQRAERAQASLAEGQKFYAAGSYKDALQSFLVALDSGVLTVPQQLLARKHMAFSYCVTNRVPLCKEEFQKAFVLSDQFDLLPAEAGHPIWGQVFNTVKQENELRRSGKSPVVAQVSASDKAYADGMAAYEAANYSKAIAFFETALKDAAAMEKKINAHKFMAFSYCVTKRQPQCRAEFGQILQLDPKFELSPAEVGHPSWGPSFLAEKAKRKQAAGK